MVNSRTAQMLLLAQGVASTQSGVDPKTRKRAVNVTIDDAVLTKAKEQGINLSQTLETTLRIMIRDAEIKQWSAENQKAVAAYNKFIGGGS